MCQRREGRYLKCECSIVPSNPGCTSRILITKGLDSYIIYWKIKVMNNYEFDFYFKNIFSQWTIQGRHILSQQFPSKIFQLCYKFKCLQAPIIQWMSQRQLTGAHKKIYVDGDQEKKKPANKSNIHYTFSFYLKGGKRKTVQGNVCILSSL